jgi:hypothetical protein
MPSNNRNNGKHGPGYGETQLTHVPPPKQPLNDLVLKILAVFTAPMLFISVSALINETGALAVFKVLLITGSACVATYTMNVIAVRQLAPLWAINYRIAGIAAITGILITGSAMFIGSLFGITNPQVTVRIFDDHGTVLGQYVAKTNDLGLQVAHIAPGARLVADDITRTSICESSISCLSKQGRGGRGGMAIALEENAARAHAIADAFDNGTVERRHILEGLNWLNAEYQDVLADQDLSRGERRAALQGIHGKIAQSANALTAALPVALLRSFAQELQGGATISGNPVGSQRLSAYLRDHGDTLAGLASELPENNLTPPGFPRSPGMWDSLRYLADFAAIGIVIFIAELVVPMTILIMTYLTLVWDIEKRTTRKDDDDDTPDKFGGLHDPVTPRPNGHDTPVSRGH